MSTFVKIGVKRLFNALYGPKYLFVTNTVSCGLMMAIGDVTVQRIEHHLSGSRSSKKNDWHRTGRLFVVGVLMGPFNHGWYTFLDKVLPAAKPLVVVKKILMDQIVAAPILAFGFFMGTNLLERIPFDKSWDEFKQKFWIVYKMDCMIWPAAQAINFFYLNPKFRVLYVSFVTIFWDSYLSFIKHKEVDGHKKEDVKVE